MIQMYVLDNGYITLPKKSIFSQDGIRPDEMMDIPIQTFLIRHPKGDVLFDAACDPEGMSKNWPEEFRESPYIVPKDGYLPERLHQLGVAPEDIKYVIASHLHIDHAGCLKYFTGAKIIVNNREFTQTLKQYIQNGDLGAHIRTDIESWLNAELKWQPLDESVRELQLMPGLTVLNFGPGHTWGMLGLLVELKNSGNILLISDAIYTSKHLGPPEILPGILSDIDGYRNTEAWIKEIATAKKAKIIFGHDMEQFRSLIKSTEGYYD